MPFKKVGKGYKSPSGKKFTAQVKAYYATGGFKRSVKKSGRGR